MPHRQSGRLVGLRSSGLDRLVQEEAATGGRAAWQHTELPGYAGDLKGRVAFAWRAMDAFYEEDERIVGHAADPYHRIDIRSTSRHLIVRYQDRVIADSGRPLALYESGFAPRWYVPRADVDSAALTPAEGQTLTPNVRWVVLHMIEETARHAGHLDLARELLDGKVRLGGR
jgi:Protein of unknown function (DUF664)/Domain of unknown function (DUF427)